MKAIIDTSSLLSLVRYYLPFDKDAILFEFFKNKIEIGEIILIDKVLDECKYNAQGIVLKTLQFFEDKEFIKNYHVPYKTDDIIIPQISKLLSQVDNNFCLRSQRNKLTDAEYDIEKNIFLNTADFKLILLGLDLLRTHSNDYICIVTEESEFSNDRKLFKKIPAICKELALTTLTLPHFLEKMDGIDLEFKIPIYNNIG